MTVCIAAICSAANTVGGGPHIVTASDTMVSGGIIASDTGAIKVEPFHENWVAMMAANDITQCLPIIEKATEYFKGRKNTLAVARAVFKKAYQRHLIELKEDTLLSGYGMTMEEFLKSGKRRFTETIFNSICQRLEQVALECQFLIHGFDSLKRPHLFKVENPGSDSVLDKPGFGAIGTGLWAAEMMLYYFKQNVYTMLNETIFNVCAAKFAAEKSVGVGPNTYLYARRYGSYAFHCDSGMVDRIRNSWDESGCPRLPSDVLDKIVQSNIGFV